MTALCHGAEAARAAEATARAVFEEGGAGEALEVVTIPEGTLGSGLSVTHFVVTAGIVPSGKEAKRLVASGASGSTTSSFSIRTRW